jgi:fructosamine-3-kinase
MKSSTAEQSKADTEHISSILKREKLFPGFERVENLRPEQISVLAGGKNAAVYLVRAPDGQVIIKIDDQGIDAEVEAFAAWRKQGARVPDIYGTGSLSAASSNGKKLKYAVQKAFVTKHGVIAETCANYLAHEPHKARAIGKLLGVELTKMHRATTDRTFGEFADSWGRTVPYRSWNNYLLGFVEYKAEYLKKIGVSDTNPQEVSEYIQQCQYVNKGRYLHGDFSIRNAAVRFEPLKVGIFDPNPVIGDPTWDIAVLFNNYEFSKRRFNADGLHKDIYDRDKQLLIGFRQGYGRTINPGSLLTAQLCQAILQAESTEPKIKDGRLDKLDMQVRLDFIKETVSKMAKEKPHG